MKRTLILTTTCGLLAVLATRPAKAQTINPGVIDPTSTYAGKTYSEWSAGFWQYYMSLAATNNPFVYNPSYPVSPLGTGQSGPVWFLCGNYANGGTHAYTNTIPGGIALFAGITDIERDNSGCPASSFSQAQLRASAKSDEDTAANMTCTVDGVAVNGLDDVLTAPYRVQSTVFNYVSPPVHNILHDLFGETCYQNASGTPPYTINGAVEDGVFLLIAPLSVGAHVIHTTCAFPSFSFVANFTHYLTVEPVALTVNASAQSGNLVLSWPQTPDNYTVQSSPSLSPTDWQPANLVVTTNNGTLQATAPVGTTNKLFRLQLN